MTAFPIKWKGCGADIADCHGFTHVYTQAGSIFPGVLMMLRMTFISRLALPARQSVRDGNITSSINILGAMRRKSDRLSVPVKT